MYSYVKELSGPTVLPHTLSIRASELRSKGNLNCKPTGTLKKESRSMETQRRRQLRTVVDRGQLVGDSERREEDCQTQAEECWNLLADNLTSESSRVRALIDQVEAEVTDKVLDDSTHVFLMLEKDAQLRVLKAYYKGLRYALDHHREFVTLH